MRFLFICLLVGVGGGAVVLAREIRIPISGTINIDASILDEYIEEKIDEEFGGISGMNGIGKTVVKKTSIGVFNQLLLFCG